MRYNESRKPPEEAIRKQVTHDRAGRGREFTCEHTPFDNYIFMKSFCPSIWKGDIAEKCANNTTLAEDILARIPVTNILTNITYRNVFCAICNGESPHIHFWNYGVAYEEESNGTSYGTADILHQLEFNEVRLSRWNLTKNGILYKFAIVPILPAFLKPYLRHCGSKHASKNTLLKAKQTDTTDTLLLKSTLCQHILPQSLLHRSLCCHCTLNAFYQKDVDFYVLNSDTVFVCEHDNYFEKSEWTPLNSTHIHVCSTYTPRVHWPIGLESRSNRSLEMWLKVISAFCLLLFTLTFLYVKRVEKLSDKVLTAQCLSLLCIGVSRESADIVAPQNLLKTLILYHYFVLSFFAWITIASYEFWFVICRLTKRFQVVGEKAHGKRFLLYCSIGYVLLPLPIVSVSAFLEFASPQLVSCRWKPGYGTRSTFFIPRKLPFIWFVYVPTAVTSFLSTGLFVHASYYIYKVKMRGLGSSARTNYFILFSKLALLTSFSTLTICAGIVLDRVVKLHDYPLLCTVRMAIFRSYGTFMYLLFAFPWKALFSRCLRNTGNNSATRYHIGSTIESHV